MNSNTDDIDYLLQAFITPTAGKDSIVYITAVADLPCITDNDTGEPVEYSFDTTFETAVTEEGTNETTLKIALVQPANSKVLTNVECTNFKIPMFFKQNDDQEKPLNINSVELGGSIDSVVGEIKVKSKVIPVKTSSLYDPKNEAEANPALYLIRSMYLPISKTPPASYTLKDRGEYLLLYCKVTSATDAPVMRTLYAIGSGTEVFCTTVPLLVNGVAPADYGPTKNIVAAHYIKCIDQTQYQTASFQGVGEGHAIPSIVN